MVPTRNICYETSDATEKTKLESEESRERGATWQDFMKPSLHTTADLPSSRNFTAETGVASVVRVLPGRECAG